MPYPPRDKVANRLKRISGQVAGLQRMVETDRACIDILTQVAAVRSALDAVGVELLSDHVEHCIAGSHDDSHAGATPRISPSAREKSGALPRRDERSNRELIDELKTTLSRFLK